MFANGTEHDAFMEHNCIDCPHYVDFEDDPANVCPVEDRIAAAAYTPQLLPLEWLDESPGQERYACRKKQGLGPKVTP